MNILKTQVKQRGFFTIGIALGLLALFGASAATVVTLDKNEKQETVAMQKMEGSQQQVATPGATTVLEQPATEIIKSVSADIR